MSTPVPHSPVLHEVAPRLRITRRGRAVLLALVAVPIAVIAGVFAINGGTASATSDATASQFEYLQVESGQTLWQLAGEVAPDSDPRDVVSDILHLNQLASSDVQPGQQLAIPERYAD